jgi:hypothetical protein
MMDVDGNGWSGRFHRLMSMKACVLKSTLFPEWYGDRIQPWVQCVFCFLLYIPSLRLFPFLSHSLSLSLSSPSSLPTSTALTKAIPTATSPSKSTTQTSTTS